MRLLPAAAVVLAMLATVHTASAFCRITSCEEGDPACERSDRKDCVGEGIAVVWTTNPLPYRIYEKGSKKLDPARMKEAIRKAIDAWQFADCIDGRTSLRFKEEAPMKKNKPLGLGGEGSVKAGVTPFGIYFRDDEWDGTEAETLAATHHAFGNRRGAISYADIEINTHTGNFSLEDELEPGEVDFQSVMTHELGHYLGLAHSDEIESIMWPRYCDPATNPKRCREHGAVGRRALGEDDIKAVCAFYPHNANATRVPDYAESGDGTTAGCTVSRGATVAPVWALVPIAALALRRRKERAEPPRRAQPLR